MSLLDRFRGGVVEAMTDATALDALEEQLAAERETTLLLQESIADLEADNRGWLALDTLTTQLQFTVQGLKEIAASARLNWLANPLIQRAVNVRMFYTWGQGVEVSARDSDVNDVVQAFMDDPLNQQVLFSHDARQDKDRAVQLDGNLFLALIASPVTGQVQLRSVPWAEITRVISNPEDREDRWFYQREWSTVVVDPVSGGIRNEPRKQFYPALGYRPATRPKSLGPFPIAWDSPLLHVRVGGLDGMDFGVSEVYSALAWARAYKGFLEDWASLAKALSRFAWKGKTRPGRASAMRQAIEEPGTVPGVRGGPGAGQAFVSSNDVTDLTPITKTGATLDADSGRPLAMMVAAAMDIPYTILMGDADMGNLATAKTLDRPTELAMQSRREMWAGIYRTVLGYAVQEAVRAPRGGLRGTIRRDERGRETLQLAGDVDANIDIEWPSILEHDIKELVDALVAADGTGHVPAEIICRLLLTALGVENVDEVMAELVDADGNFLDPRLQAAADQAVEQARGRRAWLAENGVPAMSAPEPTHVHRQDRFLTAVQPYEDKALARVRASLTRQGRVTLERFGTHRVAESNDPGDIYDPNRWDAELAQDSEAWIADTLAGIGTLMGARLGVTFNARTVRARAYITGRSTQMAGLVNGTTEQQLRQVLADAEATGAGVDAIAGRIAGFFGYPDGVPAGTDAGEAQSWLDRFEARCLTIARTETIGASNFAITEAAQQSDVATGKQWSATADGDVDAVCVELDGETVGLDESFGDIDQPPAHPNCRCRLLIVTPDGQVGFDTPLDGEEPQ